MLGIQLDRPVARLDHLLRLPPQPALPAERVPVPGGQREARVELGRRAERRDGFLDLPLVCQPQSRLEPLGGFNERLEVLRLLAVQQMPIQPSERRRQVVGPVISTRNPDELHLGALFLERRAQQLGLLERHHRVGVAVNEQQGRVIRGGVGNRRGLAERGIVGIGRRSHERYQGGYAPGPIEHAELRGCGACHDHLEPGALALHRIRVLGPAVSVHGAEHAHQVRAG